MNDLLRDAFTILFARGFIRLAQLLSFVLLARFLRPAEFGWFGIVTTAITLAATLGSLGLRQSIAYQIGREQIRAGEGTATILAVWPLLAVISAIAVYWSCGRDLPDLSPLTAASTILAGVAGTMLVMMLQGVFLGRGNIPAFSATETLPRVLLAVFAFLLAALSIASITNALWAYALSFLLAMPMAIFFALRIDKKLQPQLAALPTLIGYGVAFAFNLFLVTLCSRLSMFIIERYFDAAAAGRFFAAARVNDIFLEAATAFGLVVFSKSVQNSQVDQVIAKTANVACWIFWSFTLGASVIALFAPLVMRLLLGAEYASSGDALRILAMGLGAAAANKVIYPAIAGQGRPLFGSPVIITSLLVNFAFAIFLVPQFGINGGALALVAGQYIMLFGYVLTCNRAFNIPVGSFFFPEFSDLMEVRGRLQNKFHRVIRRK